VRQQIGIDVLVCERSASPLPGLLVGALHVQLDAAVEFTAVGGPAGDEAIHRGVVLRQCDTITDIGGRGRVDLLTGTLALVMPGSRPYSYSSNAEPRPHCYRRSSPARDSSASAPCCL
jgi:hypothetical protein